MSFSTASATTLSDSISSTPKGNLPIREYSGHLTSAQNTNVNRRFDFTAFFLTVVTVANYSQLLFMPFCKDASKKRIEPWTILTTMWLNIDLTISYSWSYSDMFYYKIIIIDSVMWQIQAMLSTILGFTLSCHVSFCVSDNEDWHFLMLAHLKLSLFVFLLATFLLTNPQLETIGLIGETYIKHDFIILWKTEITFWSLSQTFA